MSFKAPRHKIGVSEADARTRCETAKKWQKRPATYWSKKVHAYVDNKAFPIPLTEAQKARFRQTLVTGHLRKASEGLDRGSATTLLQKVRPREGDR